MACYKAFRFIKDHWRGNLSLALSCCVNGVVIALIVAVLNTYAVDQIYQSDLSDEAWLIATLALLSVSVIVSVWAIIGIWRSATSYQRKPGSITSALMAKLFSSIGALGLIAQLSQISPQIFEHALVVVGIYPFGVPAVLSINGRKLHIDGSITDEVADLFKAIISKHPEVDQVSLSSFGGSINGAVEIASIIKERNLATVAVGECSSACTIIFLSGKVRMFGIDATLGFHSPSGGGAGNVAVNGTSPETRLAYADAGLSEPFADKVFGTPSNSMWYPTEDVLINEGAINAYTNARIRQGHEQSIKSLKEIMPLKIDEFTSIVSAKTGSTNIIYTYAISLRADEIDWETMSKESQQDADTLICGEAVNNLMVKSGATYGYLYVDKNGKKVGMVKIEKCH